MDEALRNGLWNAFHACRLEPLILADEFGNDVFQYAVREIFEPIWVFFYKLPRDEIPRGVFVCLSEIRQRFFDAEWNEVYDFVEFMILHVMPQDDKAKFADLCNSFLAREHSAYRIIEGMVTLITSDTEIESIETAIEKSLPFSGVQKHLTTALSHLSDRSNPDHRNSIKESISAIESMAKHISGNESATLGDALKAIGKGEKLHPALEGAFSKLYGYASDADGIRHALMEESNIGHAEAKFMLVACSAFTNYLVEKTAEK